MKLSLIDRWRQLGSPAGSLGEESIAGISADPLARTNLLALEAFKRGEIKPADSLFKLVRDRLREQSGRKSNPELAIALTNFALSRYQRRNFSDAQRFLEEALAIRERISHGAPDPDLAESLMNLGMFHFNQGNPETASPLIERAIAMYGRLDTARYRVRLSESLLNGGVLRESIGDRTGADARFNMALDLWRRAGMGDDLQGRGQVGALRFVASVMYHRGDRAGADALVNESTWVLQKHFAEGDHPEVARSLGDLARLRTRMGDDLAAADSLYRDAVAMARRMAGGRPDSALARLLGQQGEACLRDGNVTGALRSLRESVDMYRLLCVGDVALRVELARNQVRLGNALIREGDYVSAEPPLTEAWLYYRSLRDHRPNRPEHAASLLGRGLAYNDAGEYHHAGVDFRWAIDLFRMVFERDNDPGLAPCLAEVGNAYRARGWYVRAESLLVASVDLYRGIAAGYPDAGQARAFGYMGLYYQDKGDLERAEAYFDSSIAIRRLLYHGSNPHDLVEGMRELSALRAESRDTARAEEILIEAMGLLDKAGAAVEMDLALTGGMLGRLYLMAGDYAEARGYIERAHAIYTHVSAGHDHPQLAHSIRDMAILRAYQGEHRISDSLFVAATAMYDRLFDDGFRLDPVEGLDVIGRFAERRGDSARSTKAFDRLLVMLPVITRRMSLTDGEEGQLNLQKRLAVVSNSLASYYLRRGSAEVLFNISLWLKGRILSAIQWRNDVLRELGEGDREIDSIREQYVRAQRFLSATRSSLDSTELALWIRQRAETLAISRRLEARLARRSASLKHYLLRTTWKTIRDNLKANARMVEYMRIPYVDERGIDDSVYYCAIIVRPRSQMPALVRLGEEHELYDILQYAVGESTANQKSYISDFDNMMRLYHLAWSPIDSLLKGGDSIYVSPDGLLNQVSFAPLRDESSDMLLRRYPLRYLFSPRDLVEREPVDSDAHPRPPSAVVFGGISYDMDSVTWRRSVDALGSHSAGDTSDQFPFFLRPKRDGYVEGPLPSLEGTRQEAENIAAILLRHGYTVTLDTGVRATEEAFLRLASPMVLHVATHGFFFSSSGLSDSERRKNQALGGARMLEYADDPLLRSGLLMAGASRVWMRRPPLAGLDDGIVSALDVAHMDLSRTSLVVLSACETGLGDIRSSEGVFGLKRAFKAAGAKTVVMSLWKVPDRETREMMELFYTNWFDRGMSKAGAFIEAQREMAHNTRSPYFWAGFVLVGE